jgi:hypothetical protein
MPVHRDLKGYYASLEVETEATVEAIKKAFRAKAQELHPDKNSSAEATEHFQKIAEAYRVLGHRQRRAKYDSKCLEEVEAEETATAESEPVECSVCGKISTQPRHAIYYSVVSFLVWSWVTRHEGVFCADCGAKRAYSDSFATWLLGWWAIPLGPVNAVRAIVRNMLGGKQPARENFRILAQQADYFAASGKKTAAWYAAEQALEFARRMKPHRRPEEAQADWELETAVRAIRDEIPAPRRPRKERWGTSGKAFKVQAAAAIFVITCVVGGIAAIWSDLTERREVRAQLATRANQEIRREAAVGEEPIEPPTGVLEALKSPADGIVAPLEIVTASGGPSYYINLVELSTRSVALTVFVRSGEKATVEVPLGDYELHYAQGRRWFGGSKLFGPRTVYGVLDGKLAFQRTGNRVDGYTVKLVERKDQIEKARGLAREKF